MVDERLERLKRENSKKYANVDPDDYVECLHCGMKCVNLSLHLTRVHGNSFTKEDYRVEYPDADWWPKSHKKRFSENMKGSKNPGFQHGGRLSPFSEKSGRSQSEIREAKEKASKNRKNYTSRLEYWLERTNGDHEEAQRLLSERQRTFSLSKLEEQHGKVEAEKIWRERQNKWRKSLLENYTEEELRKLKIEGMRATGNYIMYDDPELESWLAYKRVVDSYTRKTLELFPEIKVNIGRTENHIDHKFSVREGFKVGVDPKIIGSLENLECIHSSLNCSKKEKCSISLEELEENYDRFISESRSKVYRKYEC